VPGPALSEPKVQNDSTTSSTTAGRAAAGAAELLRPRAEAAAKRTRRQQHSAPRVESLSEDSLIVSVARDPGSMERIRKRWTLVPRRTRPRSMSRSRSRTWAVGAGRPLARGRSGSRRSSSETRSIRAAFLSRQADRLARDIPGCAWARPSRKAGGDQVRAHLPARLGATHRCCPICCPPGRTRRRRRNQKGPVSRAIPFGPCWIRTSDLGIKSRVRGQLRRDEPRRFGLTARFPGSASPSLSVTPVAPELPPGSRFPPTTRERSSGRRRGKFSGTSLRASHGLETVDPSLPWRF
jgi:hypothetical protein